MTPEERELVLAVCKSQRQGDINSAVEEVFALQAECKRIAGDEDLASYTLAAAILLASNRIHEELEGMAESFASNQERD